MQRVLMGILGIAVLAIVGFVLLCALLYFGQESSIFFPRQNDPSLFRQHLTSRVEILSDGATLEGWWIENPQAANRVVVLYFGGNAEDVLYTATASQKFAANRMLAVNYRGYGNSTGEPGQNALYNDALAIYTHAIERGVRPEQIVVMGRSLGSGVASMLAASRPVRAVVLITPFDSLTSVAQGHYPFVPVRWLLRHPFPSIDWAGKAQVPALFLAAERDTVIPARHAQRLFSAWAGPKEIHVLRGAGHNDIAAHADYVPSINTFLAATEPG